MPTEIHVPLKTIENQALLADGSKTDNQPDVPPPEFIEELQVLIKNFGNVEEAFREKLT
jgi:hypothetical protein